MTLVPYLYKRLVASGVSTREATLLARSTSGRTFDPLTNVYGSDTAKAKTRRALGSVLGASKSSLVPITLVGDSATSGWKAGTIGTDDYATSLISLINGAGFPVTGGWVFPGNGQTPGDGRWTFSGTNSWQGRATTTNNYVWSQATGNIATFTSTAQGTILEFGAVTTTAAQTLTYNLDSGAQTGTFNLTANSMSTKQFTGLTPGTHTVTITTTSTPLVWLCAGRVRNATGVSITNAGIYGSHTNDWLPTLISSSIINPYNLATTLGGQPKLVLVALGGNDALHGTDGTPAYTPATMKANLSTVVNAYQSAGSTVVLRTYPYLTSSNQTVLSTKQAAGVTWDDFLNNIYDVADTYDVPVIDHTTVLGDSNTLETAGLMFSDHTHLLSAGQAAIARADWRALQAM